MKKFIKFLILLAVIGAAGYWGYQRVKPSGPAYVYRTQAVERGSITSSISATGTVNAVEMVEVGTQVSGTIKELHVDFNSQVKRGQLLAVLDPDVLSSRVAESRASLSVAQAGVAKARAELDNATRNYNRNKELWDHKLIARSELDSSQTSLTLSRASLTEANSRVIQAKETLRQAETNLKYTRIVSPIDGVVISRQVDVGQTVAASLQTPTLFSIAKDLTQMQVEANIDEADIGRIQEGQKAVCRFDSWPDDSFDAVVSQKRLNPGTVSNVVTYVVILRIDNSDKKLMPGMTANISVITGQRDGIIKVPAAALRFTPPADAIPAEAKDAKEEAASSPRGQGGLFVIPNRRPGAGGGRGAEQAVWLVENGELKRRISVGEVGMSDRTWVEIRGDALNELPEGAELAVSFSKETGGSAAVGTKQ
ncbi:MAG: efflux RND transporter periplasmic adaptor subunit [Synergistaceae bacterium]|jgi:HlyD family secretion protein|nr:efflux RND transporter periplasmic adaptor subunit [Synergistaceae bacterium]